MLSEKYLCEDNKYRYIYKIVINDTKQYYIGKHSTSDLNDEYMGSGSKILEYYQLSGYSNVSKEILGYAKNESDLLKFEREEVGDKWKNDPLCLNCVPGGGDTWTWKKDKRFKTKEDYIKFCKENRKRWIEGMTDDEFGRFKENISNGLRRYFKEHDSWWNGRKHSEESKKKQSESAKKIDKFGNKNPNYGNVWITNPSTNENRLIKKSDVIPDGWIKGRYQTMTPEQIEKIRNAVIGFKWINNGKINKQIKNEQDIPNGFKLGRISHGVPQKQLDYIKRHKEELKNVNYEKYKPMYEVFINYGFEEVKRKFNYAYTRENLVQQFKKYIPDFIPQPGKKRIPLK